MSNIINLLKIIRNVTNITNLKLNNSALGLIYQSFKNGDTSKYYLEKLITNSGSSLSEVKRIWGLEKSFYKNRVDLFANINNRLEKNIGSFDKILSSAIKDIEKGNSALAIEKLTGLKNTFADIMNDGSKLFNDLDDSNSKESFDYWFNKALELLNPDNNPSYENILYDWFVEEYNNGFNAKEIYERAIINFEWMIRRY